MTALADALFQAGVTLLIAAILFAVLMLFFGRR